MKGTNHELITFIVGSLLSISLIILQYPLGIPTRLFFGFSLLSLWLSCDNDSPKSRPLQRWGILKFIWSPFVNAGHRELLHNPVWGALILCFIPAIPIAYKAYYTHDFENVWILIGLIGATWLHIVMDIVGSGWKKIWSVKYWIRRVKKAVHGVL